MAPIPPARQAVDAVILIGLLAMLMFAWLKGDREDGTARSFRSKKTSPEKRA